MGAFTCSRRPYAEITRHESPENLDIASSFPLTFDTSAHYFGVSLLILLGTAAILSYGFFLALADRPLFHDLLEERVRS